MSEYFPDAIIEERLAKLERLVDDTSNSDRAQQSTNTPITIKNYGIAGETIPAGVGVYRKTSDKKFYKIRTSDNLSQYVGISLSPYSANESMSVVWIGHATIQSGDFLANKPIYVGSNGKITSKPSGDDWIAVGTANNKKEVMLSAANGTTPLNASSATFEELKLQDTDRSNKLIFKYGEDATDDYTITWNIKGNATAGDRVLQLENDTIINQDLATYSDVTHSNLTVPNTITCPNYISNLGVNHTGVDFYFEAVGGGFTFDAQGVGANYTFDATDPFAAFNINLDTNIVGDLIVTGGFTLNGGTITMNGTIDMNNNSIIDASDIYGTVVSATYFDGNPATDIAYFRTDGLVALTIDASQDCYFSGTIYTDTVDDNGAGSVTFGSSIVMPEDGFIGIGSGSERIVFDGTTNKVLFKNTDNVEVSHPSDAVFTIHTEVEGSGIEASLLFGTVTSAVQNYRKGSIIFQGDGGSGGRGDMLLCVSNDGGSANVSASDVVLRLYREKTALFTGEVTMPSLAVDHIGEKTASHGTQFDNTIGVGVGVQAGTQINVQQESSSSIVGGSLKSVNYATNTTDISQVVSSVFQARYNGSGGITNNLTGALYSTRQEGSGLIATAQGISVEFQSTSTGNVTNVYGMSVLAPVFSSTGTVTNNVGLLIGNVGNAKVTNAYGIYITEPTNATSNNYSIYSTGGDNFFGGDLLTNGTLFTDTIDDNGGGAVTFNANIDATSVTLLADDINGNGNTIAVTGNVSVVGDISMNQNEIRMNAAASAYIDGNSNINLRLGDGTLVGEISGVYGFAVPSDSYKIYVGAGYDGSISYNGTNMIIEPREVGSGYLGINAPIVLESNSLLGTPVAGAIEYSGNKFYITDVGTQMVVDRTIGVKTSSTTVTNTTTETTVYSYALPANSLVAGNVLEFDGSGEITTASAADIATVRVKFGGVTLATLTSPGKILSADCFHIEGVATVRTIGATGSMAWHIDMELEDNTSADCDVSTIDTTGANTIEVTVQWNNAKAGNVFEMEQGMLHFKN